MIAQHWDCEVGHADLSVAQLHLAEEVRCNGVGSAEAARADRLTGAG